MARLRVRPANICSCLRLDVYVLPALGSRQVADVRRADVARLHGRIGKRQGITIRALADIFVERHAKQSPGSLRAVLPSACVSGRAGGISWRSGRRSLDGPGNGGEGRGGRRE